MVKSFFPKARFLPLPLLWISGLLLGGVVAGIGLSRRVRHLSVGSSSRTLPVGEARAGTAEGGTAGAGAQKTEDPANQPPAFSLELFQNTQGLEMHRLLARVLKGADAILVQALAEDLVKREPPLEKSPVWRGVMARWVRLDAPAALAWARAADAPAALAWTRVEQMRAGEDKRSEDPNGAREEQKGAELRVRIDKPDPFVPEPPENPHPPSRRSANGFKIDNPDRDFLGIIALREWAKADLEPALLAARDGSIPEKRALLETLMDSHPERAFPLAAAWGGAAGEFRISAEGSNTSQFLEKWAARDPVAALAYAMSAFPSGLSSEKAAWELAQIQESVARSWAVHDPAGCAAWISTLSETQRSAVFKGLETVGWSDPEAVAKVLGSLPGGPDVYSASADLAEKWGQKAPGKAWDWLRSRFPEGPDRLDAITALARSTSDTDPRTAAAMLDEAGWGKPPETDFSPPVYVTPGEDGGLEKTTFGFSCINGPADIGDLVLARLAAVDPAAAITHYQKLAVGRKKEVLADMAQSWTGREPEAALRWLAARPEAELNDYSTNYIVSQLTGMTPAAMREFALGLPPGPVRKALAARSVSSDPVATDPAGAIADLPFADAAARNAATQAILERWGETDPAAALIRLSVLPDADPSLHISLTAGWADRDPAAASAWVAALAPGENRDAAIAGLARSLNNGQNESDPSAALLWSLEIGDPAQRREESRGILEKWSGNQAQTAEAVQALTTSNALPAKDRQALLDLLQP